MELFLYTDVTSVICSSQFVSFSMKDRKLVSYLIADKNNLKTTLNKIKSLSSRRGPNDELKHKNNLISNRFLDDMEQISDEESETASTCEKYIECNLNFKNFEFYKVRQIINPSRIGSIYLFI